MCCLWRKQLWGQSRDVKWDEVAEEFQTDYRRQKNDGNVCWLVYINLIQAKVIREGASVKEKPPYDWTVGRLVRNHLNY